MPKGESVLVGLQKHCALRTLSAKFIVGFRQVLFPNGLTKDSNRLKKQENWSVERASSSIRTTPDLVFFVDPEEIGPA